MSAGADPSNDPSDSGATRRKSPIGLLGWYYSPMGTLIRMAFYIVCIALILAWKMGWIWQGPTAQNGAQTTGSGQENSGKVLNALEVTGWAKRRWQTVVPDHLPIGQLPYIEVTLVEPNREHRGFNLKDLAEGLHLYTASEPHTMLSWPVGANADDPAAAAVDEAIQPRAFNGQWIVSFLIRPDQLATLPDTLWLVYINPTTNIPEGAKVELKPMAVLTTANLKATTPPKSAQPTPATPAAPATSPAPAAPNTPAQPESPAPVH